jgi:hypothetical protein
MSAQTPTQNAEDMEKRDIIPKVSENIVQAG